MRYPYGSTTWLAVVGVISSSILHSHVLSVPFPSSNSKDLDRAMTFAELPDDAVNLVQSHLTDVKDVARLKYVNRWTTKTLKSAPAGAECVSISINFTLNQFDRVAEFPPGFLYEYVKDKWPPTEEDWQEILDDDQEEIQTRIRNFWTCVNTLAKVGYTIRGFDSDDVGLRRFLNLPAAQVELASAMQLEDRIYETSIPLSMIKHATSPTVMFVIMPRLIPSYGRRRYFNVSTEGEMIRRSNELLNATTIYLTEFVSHADEIMNELMLHLRRLMLHSFGADNPYFLQGFIDAEYLKNLTESTGVLDTLRAEEELQHEDVASESSRFYGLIRQRVLGQQESSDKQFVDRLKQVITRYSWDEYPRIKSWYDQLSS